MTPSPSPPPPHLSSRTLLDIIRDEDPHGSLFGYKHKICWKTFTDRLRLKRARAAWTSSVPIPASDVPIHNITLNSSRSLMSRRSSVRFITVSSVTPTDAEDSNTGTSPSLTNSRPLINRQISTRFSSAPPDSPEAEEANIHAVADLPPASSFRPQMSRHSSTHDSEECEEDREGRGGLATVLAGDEERAEVRMSLMDLLEVTDRKKGSVGSKNTVVEEEEEEDEEEEGGGEQRCCVCMVRHKGAALIPCGHTFCRLCSRELWVQRGNCPLCNAFILEILDIF